MTAVCALCGRHGPVHHHHLTGRPAPEAGYYDNLTMPLCPRCHGAAGGVHQVLRALGIDLPASRVHHLVHRLRRVAVTAELVAGADRSFVLDPASARVLAGVLREGADVIEENVRA